MLTQTHRLFHNGCTVWNIFLEKKYFGVAAYFFKGRGHINSMYNCNSIWPSEGNLEAKMTRLVLVSLLTGCCLHALVIACDM